MPAPRPSRPLSTCALHCYRVSTPPASPRSCPDATGLGVDIARMLLDFGLRILKGDISTDGKWCFIIFKVCLSSGESQRLCWHSGQAGSGVRWMVKSWRWPASQQTHVLQTLLPTWQHPRHLHAPVPAGVPPRWQLLKSRLDAICPSGTDTLQQLWRWRSMPKEQQPFLLQASPMWRAAMPLTPAIGQCLRLAAATPVACLPAPPDASRLPASLPLPPGGRVRPAGHAALPVARAVGV
jgi:hypothetical protein